MKTGHNLQKWQAQIYLLECTFLISVPYGWPGQWILARTIQGISSRITGHRNLRPGRGIVGCGSGRIRSQRRCQGPYLVGFMLHHHLTRTSHSSHQVHIIHIIYMSRRVEDIWRILKNIEEYWRFQCSPVNFRNAALATELNVNKSSCFDFRVLSSSVFQWSPSPIPPWESEASQNVCPKIR